MNNKIIKFNTSYGTLNMGDFIINESINREMKDLFENSFVIDYATHTPVVTSYQALKKNPVIKNCQEAKYKFICGTNILSANMLRPWPTLNINICNCRPYIDSILLGCGMGGSPRKPNLYTKLLYKKVLSKKFIHSTRDEKTKEFLNRMGYRAINTGCPTMWMLNKDHCSKIPEKKSEAVVFTLTDYCQDKENDKKMIKILKEAYSKLYFWVQGSEDYDYLQELIQQSNEKITIIYGLDAYRKLLENECIDYVGTRLHAGIYAMQKKRRSIIVAIDNRAKDMRETYALPTVDRDDIDHLAKLINGAFKTDIKINEAAIKEWKEQFRYE